MNSKQLNDLMEQVTGKLCDAGCEYFLSVTASDDEATLGSVSINMNDIDTAAELIFQSVRQGGTNGQRILSLFSKVLGLLSQEQKNQGIPCDSEQQREVNDVQLSRRRR